MLYTWEKCSRTVNPYENIIPGLSPVVLAFRQFSVICFHFLYMYPVFLFPRDCSSQSFSLLSSILGSCMCILHVARVLWAIFTDSQKYCPTYNAVKASTQSEKNHWFLWSGPCHCKANWWTRILCIFSCSLLCRQDIKIPW